MIQKNKNILYDWNNITIIPSALSDISSRKEVSINNENGKLPLFISPMDTVVDEENAKIFLDRGFEVCLPRGIKYSEELKECFFSFGLDEIIDMIDSGEELPKKILIDIANGHMKKLYETAKRIKENFNVILMIGNIANPETYKLYSEIGVDYIRCGIGGGSACTTSSNGAIHYPMASLIQECYEISKDLETPSKIIADGGFKKFPDIIKALAVGSHSVMLGGIINKSLESCSPCYIYDDNSEKYKEVSLTEAKSYMEIGKDVFKYFRGMSTKEVQSKWGKKKIKTAEGITKYNKVEYSIHGWLENFSDYLKSNMSYCNKRTIDDYRGKVDVRFITPEAYDRFNK